MSEGILTIDPATGDRAIIAIPPAGVVLDDVRGVTWSEERNTLMLASRAGGGALYEISLEGGAPVLVSR